MRGLRGIGIGGMTMGGAVIGIVESSLEDIDGIEFWVDANSMPTLFQDSGKTTPATADGDAIGCWVDKSGNGYDATQSGAARPILKLNQLNGKPAIRFSSASSQCLLASSSIKMNEDTTIFIVYRTLAAGRQTLLGQQASNALQLEILSSANKRDAMIEGAYIASTTATDATSFECLTYRRSYCIFQSIRVNGDEKVLSASATNSITSSGTKKIGCRNAGSQFFTGDMCEIIVYGRSLVSEDVNKVEEYLGNKYGITMAEDDLPYMDVLGDNDFSIIHLSDHHISDPLTYTPAIATLYNVPSIKARAVVFTGDIPGTTIEAQAPHAGWIAWRNAFNAIHIPWLATTGNHDYTDYLGTGYEDRNRVDWDIIFPQSSLTGESWWNGAFYDSFSDNSYFTITLGGIEFLFIVIEWGPRQEAVDWANTIIAANPSKTVIFGTHGYISTQGGTAHRYTVGDTYRPPTHDGEQLWTELVKLHSNIAWVLCGHETPDGYGFLQSTGDNGNTVNQALANPQSDGYVRIRIITVFPEENTVHCRTYALQTRTFIDGSDYDFWTTLA